MEELYLAVAAQSAATAVCFYPPCKHPFGAVLASVNAALEPNIPPPTAGDVRKFIMCTYLAEPLSAIADVAKNPPKCPPQPVANSVGLRTPRDDVGPQICAALCWGHLCRT